MEFKKLVGFVVCLLGIWGFCIMPAHGAIHPGKRRSSQTRNSFFQLGRGLRPGQLSCLALPARRKF